MASTPPTHDEVAQTDQALAAACTKVDRELPAAAKRNKAAAAGVVEAALDLARVARKSQSNPKMPAVKPGEPPPDGDLTQRFSALKPV